MSRSFGAKKQHASFDLDARRRFSTPLGRIEDNNSDEYDDDAPDCCPVPAPGVQKLLSKSNNGRKMARSASLMTDPDPSYHPKLLKRMGPRRASSVVTSSHGTPAIAAVAEAAKAAVAEADETEPPPTNVLVLYTGGTVGMKVKDGAYSPEPNFLVAELRKQPMFHDPDYALHFSDDERYQPLALPRQPDGKRVIYCVYEYEPLLDSSNMTYDDYARLAKDIEDQYHEFDAFIVLHGTDTMAYTASALSFMLDNLGKSVILTGSQIPIFESRSDGRDNFMGALIMAGYHNIPEVTVYFNNLLLRGNRSSKGDAESFDAFYSPNMEPLAKMEINIHVDWSSVFRPRGLHKFFVHTNMCRDVGVLRLFPSITEATVRAFLQSPMKGVVLQTYGAGNGPAARRDLMRVLKEATERGVIIVNCTQCPRGAVSPLYAVGKELEEVGVIAGSDMTEEAALMKLSFVLGDETLTDDKRRQMISMNLRGEMTVAKKTEGSHLHLSLIDKLAETMRLLSTEEKRVLNDALFPYLLCAAARDGNCESLQKLQDAGAHLQMSDYDGRTALHLACSEGHSEVVRYLLELGAPVHSRDRYGHTPLDDAVRFNHLDVIRLLREVGAHLAAPCSRQSTMICSAVVKNDKQSLVSWFEAGADFNQGDYNGRTPLHLAVMCGHESLIDFLLAHGAHPLIPDMFGQTSLDEARLRDNTTITSLLEAASAKPLPETDTTL